MFSFRRFLYSLNEPRSFQIFRFYSCFSQRKIYVINFVKNISECFIMLFALQWVEFKLSLLILPIWSLKEARLFLLKSRFFNFECSNFEVLIGKKISKWSFKGSSKIFVMMTLSIIAADFLATQVGLFIKAIAPYSNIEL